MHILRKHSKIVIIITAILFVGGMAMMGLTGIFSEKDNELGVIGDKEITIQEFAQNFEAAVYNYSQSLGGGQQLSNEQLAQINNQVWYQMVQDYVINKAIDDYAVEVSAKQIAKAIKDDPLEQIKQMEQMQTDGKFDQEKYEQALRLGQLNVEALESVYRQRLLIQNLQLDVVGKVFVSDADVRQEYIDQNQELDARVIWFNPEKVKVEKKLTQKELLDFYEANKQAFKKGESRVFDYVVVDFADDVAKGKAQEKLQKFLALVKEKGFAQAAKEMGLKAQVTEEVLKASPIFPEVDASPEMVAFLFNDAAVGDCTEIVEGENSLAVFALKSIDISPIFSFEQIEDELEQALEFQNRVRESIEQAQKFYAGKKNYLTRARAAKLEIVRANNLKVGDVLPEIGNFPALSEDLFELDKGQYTPLVVDTLTGKGAAIGYVSKRDELNWSEFAKEKEALRTKIEQERSNKDFNLWFSEQFRFLKIEDYRYKFFDYIPKQENF